MSLCSLYSKASFITTMHLILAKQATALSWRLLWEPDGSLLITPNWLWLFFFDHLRWKCWNISVFAHKWENRENPSVCEPYVLLSLSHWGENEMFLSFFFLNSCILNVPDFPLTYWEDSSHSRTSLSRSFSPTWAHPSFRDKVEQRTCTCLRVFVHVWWTETLT